MGSIPGLGRSPGGGHGNPLQYSCLNNPMDRGAWRAMIQVIVRSHTQVKQLSSAQHPRSRPRADSVSESGSLCSVVQGRGTRWEQVEKMDYPGITHKLLPFPHRMQAEQSHSRHLVYPAVYRKRTGPYSCPSEKHSHTLTIFLKKQHVCHQFYILSITRTKISY